MADWFSGDIDANGVRLHYHRTGGDKPPLLLAHGATDSGLCWTRVAEALQADYDVIMPDARGHGMSEAPLQGYSSADHAADLAAVIRGLGLDRPAVGGHSMGAAATLSLIAEYPDRVSCAILEDPPFRSGDAAVAEPGRPDPRAAMREMVLYAKANSLEATIARGRARSPRWAEAEFEPWSQAKQRVSLHFLDDLSRGARLGEWRELLPRVQCPVLLVTSDPKLGSIVTPEIAQEAKDLQPQLQVVRLNGAGHNIRREQFDAFLTTARRFLSAVYNRQRADVAR